MSNNNFTKNQSDESLKFHPNQTSNQSIITGEERAKQNLFHQFTQGFRKSWQNFINTHNRIAEWNPGGFRNPRF